MTDKAYEKAFQFRKAKIWKQLFADEYFAVKLPSQIICYCSVAGRMESTPSLVVFMNGASLLKHIETNDLSLTDCMVLMFCEKDQMTTDEYKEVKQYIRKSKTKMRNGDLLPQFIRCRQNAKPLILDGSADVEAISFILDATYFLEGLISSTNKESIGFGRSKTEIPLVEYDNGVWTVGTTEINDQYTYPEPRELDGVVYKTLKRFKKDGVLQCEVVHPEFMMRSSKTDELYYPNMFVPVDKQSGRALEIWYQNPENYDPTRFLNYLVETLTNLKICPKKIEYRTDETGVVLVKFCEAAGIQLRKIKVLRELDIVVEHLIQEIAKDNATD